jgi:hypothetical protein
MALVNFPEQMKVTLGSSFVGGGNGLIARGVNPESSDNTLILIKVSEGLYTEDGTDVTNVSTNRMRLAFNEGNYTSTPSLHVISCRLPRGTGPVWTDILRGLGYMYETEPPSSRLYDYIFKNVFINGFDYGGWNGVGGTTTVGIPDSWSGTTSAGTALTRYNPNTFSAMEEYTPPEPGREPDKTTYRYG